MSLFDWLIPKSMPHKHAASEKPAEVPPRQVTNGHANGPAATPVSDMKTQRQERRDRLYAVVREAMLRSEVLASRYKFKVLSLDAQGQEFLVMVDLLDARSVSPGRFSVIEQLIISHAEQQHGTCVKSVYWRVNEASLEVPPVPGIKVSVTPVPAPVVHVAAPVASPPLRRPVSAPALVPVFEPIDQAEVLAFKKAIGAVPDARAAVAAGQVRTAAPRHSNAATGYEDTQLLEQPDEVASPLSRTQFGDL